MLEQRGRHARDDKDTRPDDRAEADADGIEEAKGAR